MDKQDQLSLIFCVGHFIDLIAHAMTIQKKTAGYEGSFQFI
jgi:hypothetical protein